jgi:hypothetical protein
MDMSKLIPKQVHVPYLGALFDLVSKALAIVGAFNFIALTRNWFYDENDTVLRDIFGSYTLFMVVVSIIGFILLLFIYVFFVPSINSYSQKQAVIEGRSPMHEKICEINERLIRLEEKL